MWGQPNWSWFVTGCGISQRWHFSKCSHHGARESVSWLASSFYFCKITQSTYELVVPVEVLWPWEWRCGWQKFRTWELKISPRLLSSVFAGFHSPWNPGNSPAKYTSPRVSPCSHCKPWRILHIQTLTLIFGGYYGFATILTFTISKWLSVNIIILFSSP